MSDSVTYRTGVAEQVLHVTMAIAIAGTGFVAGSLAFVPLTLFVALAWLRLGIVEAVVDGKGIDQRRGFLPRHLPWRAIPARWRRDDRFVPWDDIAGVEAGRFGIRIVDMDGRWLTLQTTKRWWRAKPRILAILDEIMSLAPPGFDDGSLR